MKKIFFASMLLVTIVATAHAQISQGKTVQDPASVSRVFLWDIPTTDSMTYRHILPDTMRIVTMFTAAGLPVYVLTGSRQYQDILNWFADSTHFTHGKISGCGYVVSYIGKLSWLTKKQINNLKGSEKVTVAAFNDMEKYTMMSQAQKIVRGKMLADGTIILTVDSDESPIQMANPEIPQKKQEQIIPLPPQQKKRPLIAPRL